MVHALLVLLVVLRATVLPINCVCNAVSGAACCSEHSSCCDHDQSCDALRSASLVLEFSRGACPTKPCPHCCQCKATTYCLSDRAAVPESVEPEIVGTIGVVPTRGFLVTSNFPSKNALAPMHGKRLRLQLRSLLI